MIAALTGVTWQAEVSADDGVIFRIGRNGDEAVVAEWSGTARLVAKRDGSAHSLEFADGIDPRLRQKIERGSAWALLRSLGRKLTVHGAAVEWQGEAILLLGRSGHGKSTLAGELCRQRGARLIADDVVALDESGRGFVAWANEDHLWLDQAARQALRFHGDTDERKLPVHALAARGSFPLRAAIDLVFGGEEVALSRQPAFAAAASVVPQVVRFIVDEEASFRRELDDIHALVSAIPSFRLTRPRRFDALGRSAEAILAAGVFRGA